MQNTLKQIWILLQPSWLSGFIAVAGSAGVVIATLIISNYQGSSLQQVLFEARTGHTITSALGFQTITDNLASNPFVNNAPLFLFWAALGVIVYLFAITVWGVLSKAEALREELDYVNVSRRELLKQAVANLLIRLTCGALWLGYLELFLKIIFPYALAAAHVAAINILSLSSIGYALLGFIILAIAVQVHTVFLRLIWLRLRLLGGLYDQH